MNISQDKERDQLNIILKERPIFFIRWGLLLFVVLIFALFLFTYYLGYNITSYRQR